MKTRPRKVPRAQGTGLSPADIRAILAIQDADLDVPELAERIAANDAARRHLPAVPPLLGGAALFEERRRLTCALRNLRQRMRTFGIVATRRDGWRGRLDLLIKRFLRRLIQRHLHQQQLVHEELLKTLDALLDYLDRQDQLLRQAWEGHTSGMRQHARNAGGCHGD